MAYTLQTILWEGTALADEKSVSESSNNGAGPNKLLLGLLVLNMVCVISVGAIVFLGQKKQDAAQSIDKIAQGAAASHGEEHAAAGGEHGGAAKGGEHGGGKGGAEAGKTGLDIDARFFNVGEFTANLSGPGTSHYVRLNVNLELDKVLEEEEMKKRQAQIRDKVITLLNSKRPQDLQTSDGRGFLKEEIKTAVNAFLQTGKVNGVYFSTFVFE